MNEVVAIENLDQEIDEKSAQDDIKKRQNFKLEEDFNVISSNPSHLFSGMSSKFGKTFDN